MSALVENERARLRSLEAVVDRGLDTFIEVGEALREISSSRLYREDYDTFEAYCRGRWQMSRAYAHRTIAAAEVVAVLPIGDNPRNESQARELVPLKGQPAQLAEAWQEASAGGQPTAARVREAVQQRLPRPTIPATEEVRPSPIDERLMAACDFVRQCGSRVNVEDDPQKWLQLLRGACEILEGLAARARQASDRTATVGVASSLLGDGVDQMLSEVVAECPRCDEPIKRCDPRKLVNDRLLHAGCVTDEWRSP